MRVLDVSGGDFLDVAEGASFSRSSFGGSCVSFRVPVGRFTGCPFEEGEVVKVVWRGKTLLIGPVINPQHLLEGDSECWEVKIYDYWWNLDNIQYFVNGRSSGIFSRFRLGYSTSEVVAQATEKLSVALAGVLDHAIEVAGLPIAYDLRLDDGAEMIPFAYSSESYASLLVQIQKWRPNMAAWFEYGDDDEITLVIADHDELPEVVVDLASVDVSEMSLRARPDLVPPAVGLTCNAVVSGAQRVVTVYPSGASLSQPYAVTAEVEVPGGVEVEEEGGGGKVASTGSLAYDTPRVVVKGDKFPDSSAKAQWVARLKRWAPALNDCSNLEVAGAEVTGIVPADPEHAGYSSTAVKYELIAGSINGKSQRIKWGKVRVDVLVRATDPPETVRQYFPRYSGGKRWIGTLTFEVTTTNVSRASYRVNRAGSVESVSGGDDDPGGGGDPGGDESYNIGGVYAGVLKSYYEATRLLPYDGSVTVLDDFDQVCGGRLSVVGGLEEWASMQAVIQGVELDLKSGVSVVSVGAPEHISLQEALERSRQIADAMGRTAFRDSVENGSGNGTGGSGNGGSGDKDKDAAELPTVGPSVRLLQAPEPVVLGARGCEVGFQCRLAYDGEGAVSGAYIRRGKAMFAGGYIGGDLPEGGEGDWVACPSASGEVWLKVVLDKEGVFKGSGLSSAGGVSSPVVLAEEDREDDYVYWFHLATIDGNKVVQHVTGTVYLLVHPGTFGPAGMA